MASALIEELKTVVTKAKIIQIEGAVDSSWAALAAEESFHDWGGAGMSQNRPRFGRGLHENSPSRGLI